MVEKNTSTIDCTFFDRKGNAPYSKTIGIILNCNTHADMLQCILRKVDEIICVDGGANHLYNLSKDQLYLLKNDLTCSTPEWIVGDFESIKPEVKDYYVAKGAKLAHRSSLDTTDIEKAIYVALEKISECQSLQKTAVIVIGSGGRVDHSYSTFGSVYKYQSDYKELNTDVFMVSCSSVSFFLRPGVNRIITSKVLENREEGYSVICFASKGKVEVKETAEEGHEATALELDKEFKFGESVYFRKKHFAQELTVKCLGKDDEEQGPFLYSFTTLYHTHDRV